ncbi:hypothetical protein [uncultured Clostridium sp.]|nr:hypothetical protein [uncultured Clostridium sp.]
MAKGKGFVGTKGEKLPEVRGKVCDGKSKKVSGLYKLSFID